MNVCGLASAAQNLANLCFVQQQNISSHDEFNMLHEQLRILTSTEGIQGP